MDLQVQKKDGSLEPFDRNKIITGVVRSGGTAEEGESIATQIETWAAGAAQGGVIGSFEIKTKLLEFLGAVNPVAATTFENYQKPQA
ncbi:hypothetical protein FJZ40_01995 [Candidatus Shapirobacteria bacterium]|nr:hypothetical protein [Candidatus Shapirobacteria bacterium]